MTPRTVFALGLPIVALVFLPGPAAAQAGGGEPVFRTIRTDQLEEILKDNNLDFKKSDSPKDATLFFYDFKRGNYNMRLTYFGGKDLMIDNLFNKGAPLEQVNGWNKKAKFSRASLHNDKFGDYLMLEFNLDLAGGVTKGAIRQFISRFEQECSDFDKYIGGGGGDKVAGGDKIHAVVTDAVLEGVLTNLNVKFEKKAAPKGPSTFDLTLEGTALRVYNFGGKDLMIDAEFKKAPLGTINDYNIKRKFVRAVLYNRNGVEHTALEANLDCEAGVTDGMIRHFIAEFARDAKDFSNFLGK